MAIYGVVGNNILYNGNPVKLYDEKRKVGQADKVYMLFSTQQSTRDRTSETWITDERIDIEIIQRSEYEVTKDFIDDISEQLYTLLMPDPINDGLPDPSMMQIQHFELEQALTRSIQITDTETIIQKICTFSCKIIQQQ